VVLTVFSTVPSVQDHSERGRKDRTAGGRQVAVPSGSQQSPAVPSSPQQISIHDEIQK